MSDTTTTSVSKGMTATPGEIAGSVTHGLYRVWRAGLGLFAAAGEQIQSAFQTLEDKGERLEPAVAAPFRRVGATATRVIGFAGTPAKTVGSAVGSAVGTLGATVFKVGGTSAASAVNLTEERRRFRRTPCRARASRHPPGDRFRRESVRALPSTTDAARRSRDAVRT
jgi:hypothetical protein